MRNLWYLSLGVSLAIHMVVIVGLPTFSSNNTNKVENLAKEIKILPQNIEKLPEIKDDNLFSEKPPPYLDKLFTKKIIAPQKEFPFDKVKLTTPLKEVIFSDTDPTSEIKKTPAYMDYYKAIRERIREKAYNHYNSQGSGIVHLSFVVLNNGNLATINLLDSQRHKQELIEIALKSIKEASPFPPFPKELDYPQLQFNVSIHFKNN